LIDIAPLAGLTRMRIVIVARTQVADLAPLAGLTALQTLTVSGRRVANLAPLADLTALQTLNVSGTQVADLSPLHSLISQGCPVRWSSKRRGEGRGIYAEGCPLINPPAEIVNQGNDAILNYLRVR
jgi:Leucine-rich repeat (LRR) protein